MPLPVAERDWLQVVRDFARLRSWLEFHVHDSRRSPSGFPDLVCVRGDRMVAAELKNETGKVTPDQAAWLDALGAVAGVEVYVWRPSSWPEVERVLS